MNKNTRKLKKAALLLCSAVLLVCISIGATVAYLTSTDEVVNTFTVGNVQIKLDEAKAKADGTLDTSTTDRVKANSYKLLPGHEYKKDPMVTVLNGSEPCYVKMTVTFSKAAELDAIFAPTGADLTSIFNGYDSNNWTYITNTENSNNTRTYEFWYKAPVDASNGDVKLDALFDSITVPGTITNEQLATIEGMTITVNAYAIQADGFGSAADAWKAYAAA